MILIPEIETVVILVPRTASGSLRRAIAARYPRSMQIYRHMEADGVPAGYDRWCRIGIVRRPFDRLWSLYKFMRVYRHPSPDTGQGYVEALRRSVERPFDEWLIRNETVFTSPYDSEDMGRYWPGYTVRHALPENRKSQFVYLRPDLGTEVIPYEQLSALEQHLGLSLGRTNTTDSEPAPILSLPALAHVERCFAWDIAAAGGLCSAGGAP